MAYFISIVALNKQKPTFMQKGMLLEALEWLHLRNAPKRIALLSTHMLPGWHSLVLSHIVTK